MLLKMEYTKICVDVAFKLESKVGEVTLAMLRWQDARCFDFDLNGDRLATMQAVQLHHFKRPIFMLTNLHYIYKPYLL